MIADATGSNAESALSIWRGPAAWMRASDIIAVLLAASLPWSTSLVAIFAVIFVLSLIATFDLKAFMESLKRPACALPVAMFALAAVGTLWASDIPWPSRLFGIVPVAKLLMIPVLIYHFERSSRGFWIVVAFFVSCSALLLLSWIMYIAGFTWTGWQGVPVKNYIAQSQEFALCAFGAAGAAIFSLRGHRPLIASALLVLALAFLANMVFVAGSRTAFVCIPALLLIFAFRFLNRTGFLVFFAAAMLAALLAWGASTYLRDRIDRVSQEFNDYAKSNAVTSTGMRLEFWRKSIKFVERAPLFGHGTGATKALFERDAVGQTGVSSEVIGNPHNQTLNVAVQWGAAGVIALYALWISHLLMFRDSGVAAWIGLTVVAENIVSSLLNSHIFDFHEGWIYVLGVGVLGGVVLRRRSSADDDATMISDARLTSS